MTVYESLSLDKKKNLKVRTERQQNEKKSKENID